MSSRLDDAVILHGFAIDPCTARVDKQIIGYYSLQYCQAGEVDLWYNARHWRLGPGWCWPGHPGPRIRFQAAVGTTAWNHRYLAVRGPLVDSWRREGLWPDEPLEVPEGIDAARAFDGIYPLWAEGTTWSRRRAINRLEDLLLALAAARGRPREAPWLGRAKALLACAAIPVDVPAVARDCAMAVSTFRSRFAAATGMSPRDFALGARIERACLRLREGTEPVARIALDLGYPEPTFFIRQFRQRTGLTPRAYRLSHQG